MSLSVEHENLSGMIDHEHTELEYKGSFLGGTYFFALRRRYECQGVVGSRNCEKDRERNRESRKETWKADWKIHAPSWKAGWEIHAPSWKAAWEIHAPSWKAAWEIHAPSWEADGESRSDSGKVARVLNGV